MTPLISMGRTLFRWNSLLCTEVETANMAGRLNTRWSIFWFARKCFFMSDYFFMSRFLSCSVFALLFSIRYCSLSHRFPDYHKNSISICVTPTPWSFLFVSQTYVIALLKKKKKSEKIHTCFLFERSRDCVWNSGAFSRTKVNSLTRVQLSLTRTIVSYFYFLSGITFRFWQSFSSEPCRAYALSAIEQNTSAQSMASVISYKFLSALKRKR